MSPYTFGPTQKSSVFQQVYFAPTTLHTMRTFMAVLLSFKCLRVVVAGVNLFTAFRMLTPSRICPLRIYLLGICLLAYPVSLLLPIYPSTNQPNYPDVKCIADVSLTAGKSFC